MFIPTRAGFAVSRTALNNPSRRLTALSSQFSAARNTAVSHRTMASSSLPKTMKGVIINKTGGVDVLEYKTDLPLPQLKEGQVLVKNDFIGVNYIDTYVFLC